MGLDFITPQFFDALIIGVIVIGLALAAVRLYADFTRPLPPVRDDDTRPRPPRAQRDDSDSQE